MKKIFTLAATLFAAICMNASDITIALTSMTAGENSYAYDGAEIKAKSNNVYIELPGANVQGSITIKGSSNKSDRFLYIYGEGGTVKDESRAIEMKSDGETINFSASDIILVSEVPYLLFSTADDFKFKKFNYTYEEGKTIVSTVETLTAVKVNGTAISGSNFADLISSHYVNLDDQYITAPVVTFTKHTVITYDDQTTKESDTDIDVTAELVEVNNVWEASAVIAETEYRVNMQKAASHTVTYLMMEGSDEIVLGTELVAVGEHPAEYAQYEVRPLCSFNGWYDSDPLEMVDLSQVVVNADMSFYADFVKAYAQSIDFEGMVLNQGKSYDVKSALMANFYDYKTIDALDSLNNSKGAARNEPYLGLKIKKQGGYLACNVLPGTTLRIKFGYVAETVLAIAGNDTLRLVPTDNKLAELTVPFAIEKLVKLQTTSDKTVVIKQIMVDDPIVTWMYPITYTAGENGTIEGWTIALPGEEVKVSHAAAEGYRTYSLTYNGVALHDDENKGYVTFTMPAEAVAVEAEFLQEFPTAIENTEAEVKAVKVIRDGKLFIEKNGVLYNAQGTVVK